MEGNISYKIELDDFNNVCRTCLEKSSTARKSFNEAVFGNKSVFSLLEKFISMQELECDYLPQSLCNECVSKLVEFYKFEEKCVRNERILLGLHKKLVSGVLEYSTSGGNNFESEDEEVLSSIKIEEEVIQIPTNAAEEKCDPISEDIFPVSEIPTITAIESAHPVSKKIFRLVEIPIKNANPVSKEMSPVIVPTILAKENGDPVSKEISPVIDPTLPAKENANSPSKSKSVSKKNLKIKNGIKCIYCDVVCASQIALIEHKKEAKHPKRRMYVCTECGKLFTNTKLIQHMRSHTKEKPFVCTVCGIGFSVRGNLNRHVMTHTGEKPHVCDICGKGFIQSNALVVHKAMHIRKEKSDGQALNLVCNYCGRSFKHEARFNTHLIRHFSIGRKQERNDKVEKPKEYLCEICNRAYKTKNQLRVHSLTHGEKRFLCSHCGKAFKTSAALDSHEKVHTGEKPYKCTICKKAFAQIFSFNVHMLTHTGEKPYACDICGRTFKQSTHLMYHKRTHSGERPYSCSFCEKRFTFKHNLTVHIRTHTGETPFVCSECGRGFHDSSNLKKHLKAHKQIEEQLNSENISDAGNKTELNQNENLISKNDSSNDL